MSARLIVRLGVLVMLALGLSACQTGKQAPKEIMSNKSAVELRAMQARAFETGDVNKTLRTVIATLQDLGYTIDKVEPAAGTVSGTKLAQLRITVTVYSRKPDRTIVRANAIVILPGSENQVDDPAFYQQYFFEPLSKALFLNALQVEDGD